METQSGWTLRKQELGASGCPFIFMMYQIFRLLVQCTCVSLYSWWSYPRAIGCFLTYVWLLNLCVVGWVWYWGFLLQKQQSLIIIFLRHSFYFSMFLFALQKQQSLNIVCVWDIPFIFQCFCLHVQFIRWISVCIFFIYYFLAYLFDRSYCFYMFILVFLFNIIWIPFSYHLRLFFCSIILVLQDLFFLTFMFLLGFWQDSHMPWPGNSDQSCT
jgi:hypothetical protein